MIIAQEPAQPLAAAHGSLALLARRSRKQQDVALLLIVPSRQIFVPPQQLLVHRPRHVGQDARESLKPPSPVLPLATASATAPKSWTGPSQALLSDPTQLIGFSAVSIFWPHGVELASQRLLHLSEWQEVVRWLIEAYLETPSRQSATPRDPNQGQGGLNSPIPTPAQDQFRESGSRTRTALAKLALQCACDAILRDHRNRRDCRARRYRRRCSS